MMNWWKKKFIVVSGFLEALVFSGCLFGWPSLLLVLQEEGIYSNVCESDMLQVQRTRNNDKGIYRDDDNLHHNNSSSNAMLGNLMETFANEPKEIYPESTQVYLESQTTNQEDSVRVRLQTVHDEKEKNCTKEDDDGCTGNLRSTFDDKNRMTGCDEQRVHMTLVYTFAAVAYGVTAVFIGLSLEVLGLRATRFIGSMFATSGFLFLAYTTPETSHFLWFALNLIALGTNQLRLSGFQFADLWPKYRATILTSYSSAYSISTTFFLVVQLLYEHDVPMQTMFIFAGGMCVLTCIPTFFMPKMKIEIDDRDGIERKSRQPAISSEQELSVYVSQNATSVHGDRGKMRPFIDNDYDGLALPQLQINFEDNNQNKLSSDPFPYTEKEMVNGNTNDAGVRLDDNGQLKSERKRNKYNFMSSLFSLSGILHMHWQFINLFLILFYSSTFNIWASKITSDNEKVSFYIKMSGVCCLIAPAFVPMIGFATDKMIRRAEMRGSRVERLAYTMQAPTFAMAGATTLLILTMICKLFLTETAIYISLVLIALSRPAVVGSCTSYIRLRFPGEHFNMLNGVFTTVISILCFVQYPIMKWMTSSRESYAHAHWLLLLILIASLASPIHMMIRKNVIHYAALRLNDMD